MLSRTLHFLLGFCGFTKRGGQAVRCKQYSRSGFTFLPARHGRTRMSHMNRLRQWIVRAGRNTWNNWPQQAYARASYRRRLAAVERHLHESLDLAPAGEVRIVSLCAGDGRDVVDVVGVASATPRGVGLVGRGGCQLGRCRSRPCASGRPAAKRPLSSWRRDVLCHVPEHPSGRHRADVWRLGARLARGSELSRRCLRRHSAAGAGW